jgi:hypothetical protein
VLRLSHDGELEGIDIHEHGSPAYHMEFGQGMTYTTLIGAGGGKISPPDVEKSSPVGVET